MIKLNNSFILFSVFIFFIFLSCNRQKEEKDKLSEKKSDTTGQVSKNDIKTDSSVKVEKEEKYNPKYNSYKNPRFEFTVKYPANIEKRKDPANSDGCEFVYEDGFNIKVYGSNEPSVMNLKLDEIYKSELKNHKDVTYKTKKDNWYVISGYDGNMIFYEKTFVGKESKNTLYIEYPSNLRDKYYDVISVISKSFTAGNLDTAN